MAPSLTTFAATIVASIGGWQLYDHTHIVQEAFTVAPPAPPSAVEKLQALCEAYTGPALLSCPHIIAIAATVKESWPFDDQTTVGVAVLGDLILFSLFGFCLRRCRGASAKDSTDVSVDALASVGAVAKADSDAMFVSYAGCSCSAAAALHLQQMAEMMTQGAGLNGTGNGKLTEVNAATTPEVNGCWPKAADQIEENTVDGVPSPARN